MLHGFRFCFFFSVLFSRISHFCIFVDYYYCFLQCQYFLPELLSNLRKMPGHFLTLIGIIMHAYS